MSADTVPSSAPAHSPRRWPCPAKGGGVCRGRLQRLRRVRPALAGETLTFADVEMDTVGHKVRRSGQVIPLGPTEFRLLKHFLEHPGWVFSRERLLDSVWGQDSDIELRTVDVHIRRLRKAINADGQYQDIIRTVRSAGYALDTEGMA